MTDPLAQYRKKPPGTVAEPTPPTGPEEYVAFDAKDKVDRLLIRSAKVQARSPGYRWGKPVGGLGLNRGVFQSRLNCRSVALLGRLRKYAT